MAVPFSRQVARGLAVLILLFGLFGSYLKTPSSPGRARTHLADKAVFENSRAGNLSRLFPEYKPKAPEAKRDKCQSCLYTVIDDGARSNKLIVRELIRAGTPGFYPTKSGSPPLHTHINEEECFKVLSGRFQYSLDGLDSSELVPGDDLACIPAGHPHHFWNADSSRDLEVEYTVTPPGNMLAFFRTYCGLAQDSKGGTLDSVNPLQLLVTFKHAGMAMNIMPKPIWLMMQYVWVPLLEFFFQPFYAEYSGITK